MYKDNLQKKTLWLIFLRKDLYKKILLGKKTEKLIVSIREIKHKARISFTVKNFLNRFLYYF